MDQIVSYFWLAVDAIVQTANDWLKAQGLPPELLAVAILALYALYLFSKWRR